MSDEEHRIERRERRYMRKQSNVLGWTLLAMVIMAVGAMLAQVIFGHHVW